MEYLYIYIYIYLFIYLCSEVPIVGSSFSDSYTVLVHLCPDATGSATARRS